MDKLKPLLDLEPNKDDVLQNVRDLMLVGGLAIKRIDYESAKRLNPELDVYGAMQYYSVPELMGILSRLVEQVDIQCTRMGISSETWMNREGFLLKRAQDYCMLGRAELARQRLRE